MKKICLSTPDSYLNSDFNSVLVTSFFLTAWHFRDTTADIQSWHLANWNTISANGRCATCLPQYRVKERSHHSQCVQSRGVATGWTGVDMSTPLLPEVVPEIDANPVSFYSGGARRGQSWNWVTQRVTGSVIMAGSGRVSGQSYLLTDPVSWPGCWQNDRMIHHTACFNRWTHCTKLRLNEHESVELESL